MTDSGNDFLKYVDLLDEFITVRAFDQGTLPFDVPKHLNSVAYRRAVVESCVVDYASKVRPLFRRSAVYTEDSVIEALYNICVDVNPHLSITEVALPTGKPAVSSPALETEPAAVPDRIRSGEMFDYLTTRIVGQDTAARRVADTFRRAKYNLRNPRKPRGVMLFVGPSGMGKTEMGKAVADYGFGSNLVRIDCSEYVLPHERAKLIGAPPGYVGYHEGGLLTGRVRTNPRSVVLFDEVEKAHQNVHDLLLQLFDDGVVTASDGVVVPFNQTFVVMTSNIGAADAQRVSRTVGFNRRHPSESQAEDLYQDAVRKYFRPELVNRIDAVVPFRTLDKGDVQQIARLTVGNLNSYLAPREVSLSLTPAAAALIADRADYRAWGARHVERIVETGIADPLAVMLERGKVKKGDRIAITADHGELVLSVQ
ncbi:MAG: ATP-dependent Clp protease ATP-binding subunit [Candidatus Aenigmarchaeota archaeon]|nr:ATP-dependent Clp protease ATP-binding subunit [Candidatus Aenigmarchaeota archaeon]